MAFIKWDMVEPRAHWYPRGEWLQRGDLVPNGEATSWECPWCGYSLLFWAKDEVVAEEAARGHMLNQHGLQVWQEGRVARWGTGYMSR